MAQRLVDCRRTRAGRTVVNVQPFELRALGEQLARISQGESADHIFKQDLETWWANKLMGRDTDSRRYDLQRCAVLYWRKRCEGQTQKSAADSAIAEVFGNEPSKPKPKTIVKIAGKHKDQMLDAIAGKSVVRLPDGSVKTEYRSGVDISRVRKSITRKSHKGLAG